MSAQKFYVVQRWDGNRWEDVREPWGGLVQVIHYSRMDESIKKAKLFPDNVRVVRRNSHKHSIDDGWTVAIVWERL